MDGQMNVVCYTKCWSEALKEFCSQQSTTGYKSDQQVYHVARMIQSTCSKAQAHTFPSLIECSRKEKPSAPLIKCFALQRGLFEGWNRVRAYGVCNAASQVQMSAGVAVDMNRSVVVYSFHTLGQGKAAFNMISCGWIRGKAENECSCWIEMSVDSLMKVNRTVTNALTVWLQVRRLWMLRCAINTHVNWQLNWSHVVYILSWALWKDKGREQMIPRGLIPWWPRCHWLLCWPWLTKWNKHLQPGIYIT